MYQLVTPSDNSSCFQFRPTNCFSWRGAVGECQAFMPQLMPCVGAVFTVVSNRNPICRSSNSMKFRHRSTYVVPSDSSAPPPKNNQSSMISQFIDSLFYLNKQLPFFKDTYFQMRKRQHPKVQHIKGVLGVRIFALPKLSAMAQHRLRLRAQLGKVTN